MASLKKRYLSKELGDKDVRPEDIWEKSILGRGNSRYKGPEMGACLVCLWKNKKTSVNRGKWVKIVVDEIDLANSGSTSHHATSSQDCGLSHCAFLAGRKGLTNLLGWCIQWNTCFVGCLFQAITHLEKISCWRQVTCQRTWLLQGNYPKLVR